MLVPLSHNNEKQNKNNNSSAKVLNILNELEMECNTTGDKKVCNRYDNLHEHVHRKVINNLDSGFVYTSQMQFKNKITNWYDPTNY